VVDVLPADLFDRHGGVALIAPSGVRVGRRTEFPFASAAAADAARDGSLPARMRSLYATAPTFARTAVMLDAIPSDPARFPPCLGA
jgi:hypothetical protein